MRTPHPALMKPYQSPLRELLIPKKEEISHKNNRWVSAYGGEQVEEPAVETRIESKPMATEVRTEIRCGEFGYWCHNSCYKHGRCMYLPRSPAKLLPEGTKCANDRCDKECTRVSKYCSSQCRDRQNSRDSYRRKHPKSEIL